MKFTDNLDISIESLSARGGFLTIKDNDGNVNTMVISWGFIGNLWQKPHFITFVRPQRFTKQFIDNAVSFTISIPLSDNLKEELKICGTKSGKDIDKSKVVKYLDAEKVDSPIIDGCNIYYECKIDYRQKLDSHEIPVDIVKGLYKNDFHTMYFGEIINCYKK